MKNIVIVAFLLGMVSTASAQPIRDYISRDSVSQKGYTLIFYNKDPGFSPIVKKRMEETFFKVYPVMVERFNKKAPTKLTFVIDPEYKGVAFATWGGRVVYSPAWFAQHPEDIDVVTHEVMHVVQGYGRTPGPGWLTEGIADFVRYKYGVNNEQGGWRLPELNARHHYTNSYRITARFLKWMEENMGENVINRLDMVMRDHTYTDNIWVELTGMTVDDLWKAYMEAEGITPPTS